MGRRDRRHRRRELETYDPTSDGSTTRQLNLRAEWLVDRAVEPVAGRDETEKIVVRLGGLLLGQQGSYRRANQRTVPSGRATRGRTL